MLGQRAVPSDPVSLAQYDSAGLSYLLPAITFATEAPSSALLLPAWKLLQSSRPLPNLTHSSEGTAKPHTAVSQGWPTGLYNSMEVLLFSFSSFPTDPNGSSAFLDCCHLTNSVLSKDHLWWQFLLLKGHGQLRVHLFIYEARRFFPHV